MANNLNIDSELAPCPFCGAQAPLIDHASDCYFELKHLGASRSKVEEAWNRRAPLASAPATDPAYIMHQVNELINDAKAANVVVQIGKQYLAPYAMGNYVMTATVYPDHSTYRKPDEVKP